eukprot:gene1774-2701_t
MGDSEVATRCVGLHLAATATSVGGEKGKYLKARRESLCAEAQPIPSLDTYTNVGIRFEQWCPFMEHTPLGDTLSEYSASLSPTRKFSGAQLNDYRFPPEGSPDGKAGDRLEIFKVAVRSVLMPLPLTYAAGLPLEKRKALAETLATRLLKEFLRDDDLAAQFQQIVANYLSINATPSRLRKHQQVDLVDRSDALTSKAAVSMDRFIDTDRYKAWLEDEKAYLSSAQQHLDASGDGHNASSRNLQSFSSMRDHQLPASGHADASPPKSGSQSPKHGAPRTFPQRTSPQSRHRSDPSGSRQNSPAQQPNDNPRNSPVNRPPPAPVPQSGGLSPGTLPCSLNGVFRGTNPSPAFSLCGSPLYEDSNGEASFPKGSLSSRPGERIYRQGLAIQFNFEGCAAIPFEHFLRVSSEGAPVRCTSAYGRTDTYRAETYTTVFKTLQADPAIEPPLKISIWKRSVDDAEGGFCCGLLTSRTRVPETLVDEFEVAIADIIAEPDWQLRCEFPVPRAQAFSDYPVSDRKKRKPKKGVPEVPVVSTPEVSRVVIHIAIGGRRSFRGKMPRKSSDSSYAGVANALEMSVADARTDKSRDRNSMQRISDVELTNRCGSMIEAEVPSEPHTPPHAEPAAGRKTSGAFSKSPAANVSPQSVPLVDHSNGKNIVVIKPVSEHNKDNHTNASNNSDHSEHNNNNNNKNTSNNNPNNKNTNNPSNNNSNSSSNNSTNEDNHRNCNNNAANNHNTAANNNSNANNHSSNPNNNPNNNGNSVHNSFVSLPSPATHCHADPCGMSMTPSSANVYELDHTNQFATLSKLLGNASHKDTENLLKAYASQYGLGTNLIHLHIASLLMERHKSHENATRKHSTTNLLHEVEGRLTAAQPLSLKEEQILHDEVRQQYRELLCERTKELQAAVFHRTGGKERTLSELKLLAKSINWMESKPGDGGKSKQAPETFEEWVREGMMERMAAFKKKASDAKLIERAIGASFEASTLNGNPLMSDGRSASLSSSPMRKDLAASRYSTVSASMEASMLNGTTALAAADAQIKRILARPAKDSVEGMAVVCRCMFDEQKEIVQKEADVFIGSTVQPQDVFPSCDYIAIIAAAGAASVLNCAKEVVELACASKRSDTTHAALRALCRYLQTVLSPPQTPCTPDMEFASPQGFNSTSASTKGFSSFEVTVIARGRNKAGPVPVAAVFGPYYTGWAKGVLTRLLSMAENSDASAACAGIRQYADGIRSVVFDAAFWVNDWADRERDAFWPPVCQVVTGNLGLAYNMLQRGSSVSLIFEMAASVSALIEDFESDEDLAAADLSPQFQQMRLFLTMNEAAVNEAIGSDLQRGIADLAKKICGYGQPAANVKGNPGSSTTGYIMGRFRRGSIGCNPDPIKVFFEHLTVEYGRLLGAAAGSFKEKLPMYFLRAVLSSLLLLIHRPGIANDACLSGVQPLETLSDLKRLTAESFTNAFGEFCFSTLHLSNPDPDAEPYFGILDVAVSSNAPK